MRVYDFTQISPSMTTAVSQRKIFRPILMSCLIGMGGFSLSTQAALANNSVAIAIKSDAQKNNNISTRVITKASASPTSELKLINLQGSDEIENNIDEFLELDNNVNVSNPDYDIDALGENINEALIEDSDDTYDELPNEVSNVSLKAISPETLKTFVAVVDLVRREYVDAVNDETLFNNAMSGMLTKLDSYAEFLDAEAYENLRAFTQGDVGDVGIKAIYRAEIGYWTVTEVLVGSPADKKGVTIGDYLHQIGEFKLDDERQPNDVKQLLTGIAGSQIDVVVSKEGRRKRAITLQRNNTRTQTIETRLVDGIAVIKLPAFQDTTRETIVQSLIDLESPIAGILIDVRDNPGGVLTSAVDVASLFMSDTEVVQVKGRQGDPRTLMTKGSAILESLPVVILQNRYSASAAEVLSSSLQAEKRATIVGETSYGKGSVQSVIALNDEQAVKLTVAHYLTASGVKIDKVGVRPDQSLSGSERTWEQQGLALLRAQIRTSGIRLVRKGSVYDNSTE